MAASPSALFIVDRGVSYEWVARLVNGQETGSDPSAVFLEALSLSPWGAGDASLVADYVPGTAIGADGENLVAAAIALANRLAIDLVDTLQASDEWRPMLDYDGISLRSILYYALASHLLTPIRLYFVIRENVTRRRPCSVKFISSDPLRTRVFKLVAPDGEAICPPGRPASGDRIARRVRDGARFVRDLGRARFTAHGVAWPTTRSTASRVLFVAGNARVCEQRHPNVFEAVRDSGMELGVLCYPGQAGPLAVPHFPFADVRVGARAQLRKWRYCVRWWGRAADLARLFARRPSRAGEIEPLVALLKVEAASFLVANTMYVSLDLLEIMKSAFRALRPDVVFFDNRQLVGLCAGLAGRACDVPTVWLQDGVVGGEEPGLMVMEADRCAAWGEATGRYLRGAGVEPARVTVVGAPIADTLATRRFLDRAQLGGVLGLELTSGDVLLSYMSAYVSREILGAFAFSGNSFQHKRAVLESICRMVLGLPGVKLVIKLHPNDPDREVDRTIVSELLPVSRFVMTDRQDLLHDILAASDLVIIHDGSTTGVEAAALGRPMVSVDCDGINGAGTNSWVDEGVAVGVSRPEEMERSVRAALFEASVGRALSERRETFLQRYVYEIDGKNCDRFVRLLDEIIVDRRST